MKRVEPTTENQIIGVFMGYKIYDHASYKPAEKDERHIYDSSLEYDRDWNKLMEVVAKIENTIVNEDLQFSVEIRNQGCRIYRSWTTSQDKDFGWHQTGDKLKSTYKAVVEAITWINENKIAE